jgi:hypothetical protein
MRHRVARGEVRGKQRLWHLWEWALCCCHQLMQFLCQKTIPLSKSPREGFLTSISKPVISFGTGQQEVTSSWNTAS